MKSQTHNMKCNERWEKERNWNCIGEGGIWDTHTSILVRMNSKETFSCVFIVALFLISQSKVFFWSRNIIIAKLLFLPKIADMSTIVVTFGIFLIFPNLQYILSIYRTIGKMSEINIFVPFNCCYLKKKYIYIYRRNSNSARQFHAHASQR